MSSTRDSLAVEVPEPIDGLRVALQPAPALSASVAITFLASAGSGRDPPGREGAALFTLESARVAAGPWRRAELARRLDRLGATITTHFGPESSEITVWGPADAWEGLLEALARVVLEPRFDPEDVAKVRREMAERQLRERTQPDRRAELELFHAIFPRGHPYRETGAGSPRSLESLDREQIQRFHRRHYVASEAGVVMTSNVPSDRARRAIARAFRDLDRRARLDPVPVPPPRARGPEVRVRISGLTDVHVRIGGPSLPRSDPEYPALDLAHEILGGRPVLNRLFQNVREKHGLAYHASGELESMAWGGYWAVDAGSAPKNWERTRDALRAEVARLAERAPSCPELDLIRESAIGEIPLSLETTLEAHDLAVDLAYHRLPPDFWKTWPAVLRRVRPDEVRAAAQRGLDLERSRTIVVGAI